MLDVDINITAPDPNDCPATFVEMVALLDTLITGTVIGDFLPYITGTDTPGSDDQDKVWHRLDTNGKPIGSFIYFNGKWRREYSGRLGQICLYSGDPAFDFDDSGRGKIEGDDGATGEWDGWHLCNGEDGTEDLRDKFIVGGRRYNANLWESDVSVVTPAEGPPRGAAAHTGGTNEITLTSETTFQPAVAPIVIGQWTAEGNAPGVSLFGPTNGGGDVTFQAASDGVPEPDPIPVLPPYLAVAYVVFVGYL